MGSTGFYWALIDFIVLNRVFTSLFYWVQQFSAITSTPLGFQGWFLFKMVDRLQIPSPKTASRLPRGWQRTLSKVEPHGRHCASSGRPRPPGGKRRSRTPRWRWAGAAQVAGRWTSTRTGQASLGSRPGGLRLLSPSSGQSRSLLRFGMMLNRQPGWPENRRWPSSLCLVERAKSMVPMAVSWTTCKQLLNPTS